jgi:hypothetical protein
MFKIKYPFVEALFTILKNQLITLNQNEIESLYVKWSSEFSDDLSILSDIISKDSIKDNQNVPSHSCLNGIDLPTWFGEFQNKKVIFLGIDPMRNDKDFHNSNADTSMDVLVGTPYAFHIKAFRENRTSPYWHVISEVAKSNFVYVTDIYKTFFYTDNTKKIRSYEFWNKSENANFNQNHRKLLVDEINLIEPDIIVTFGALAYKVLANQKYCPTLSLSLSNPKRNVKPFTGEGVPQERPIPIVPLMHLSGSTRGKNLEAFFMNNGLKYSEKYDKRNKAGHLYGQLINDYIANVNKPAHNSV